VEIIILPDTKEFPVAIATCLKLVSGAEVSVCERHGSTACTTCKSSGGAFGTYKLSSLGLDWIVVFDNISQLADSAMNYICRKETDEYKPEWQDFRVQGTMMSKFLTNVQQASWNSICIAHITETEMEDGSKKLLPQVGTVPFSRGAAKYFDHIVYCNVMNKSHRFGSATTYSMNAVTGSRRDIKIEDAKVPSLLPFFNGEYLKQAEEQQQGVKVAKEIVQETKTQTVIPINTTSAPALTTTNPGPQSDRLKALLAKVSPSSK
jgi:hypothetical protein